VEQVLNPVLLKTGRAPLILFGFGTQTLDKPVSKVQRSAMTLPTSGFDRFFVSISGILSGCFLNKKKWVIFSVHLDPSVVLEIQLLAKRTSSTFVVSIRALYC